MCEYLVVCVEGYTSVHLAKGKKISLLAGQEFAWGFQSLVQC